LSSGGGVVELEAHACRGSAPWARKLSGRRTASFQSSPTGRCASFASSSSLVIQCPVRGCGLQGGSARITSAHGTQGGKEFLWVTDPGKRPSRRLCTGMPRDSGGSVHASNRICWAGSESRLGPHGVADGQQQTAGSQGPFTNGFAQGPAGRTRQLPNTLGV